MHSSTKLVPGQRTPSQANRPARARHKAQPAPPGTAAPPACQPPSRPLRQMDLRSARALLLCCKAPLGPCSKIMLDAYIDESRDFARRVECEPACWPLLPPADRCCEHGDNGRCQGHVGRLAAAQLCAVHQTRAWGDRWLADCRHLAALPEDRVMTPEGWFMRQYLQRLLNRAG